MRRACVTAVLALAILGSGTAAAWDDAAHVSIAKAALLISPAAAARIPPGLRQAFLDAAATIEVTDVTCRKHVGRAAGLDPAAEAQKSIEELRRTWDRRNAFRRVEILGRAVHFASDCAVPTAVRNGQRLYSWAFFPNAEIAVFREPAPLKPSIAEALRRHGARALWADDGAGADSFSYRLAVNLAVETLLLVPAAMKDPNAPDRGPVLFVVNRLVKQKPVTGQVVDGVADGAQPSAPMAAGGGGKAALGPAKVKENLLSKRGIQFAEWTSSREGSRTAVRAVLIDNDDRCATRIVITAPAWRLDIPGTVSPRALRAVSFSLPNAVTRADLTLQSTPGSCPEVAAQAGQIPGRNRLVFWSTGRAPAFESPADPERDDQDVGEAAGEGGSKGPGLSALIAPALLGELPETLQLGQLTCRTAAAPWTCTLVVRSTAGSPPPALFLQLKVSWKGGVHESSTESVTFDLASLPMGVRREIAGVLTPTRRGTPGAIQVVSVTKGRRDLPASSR